jgi:ppGpp synthetase/RelA/SpoT-type nucleotidyltranferase
MRVLLIRVLEIHRGMLIEVQLRTENQDFWANAIEALSRKVAPGLKFGEGPEELAGYFRTAGEVFAFDDRNEPVPQVLMTELQDLQELAGTFMENLR